MTGTNNFAAKLASNAPVFARLGTIVRDLHEALRELGADTVLAEAVCELPSARERLLHIGMLTERAANTVLSKVEQLQPIQDSLAVDARTLQQQWQALASAGPLPAEMAVLMQQTLS